MLSQYKIYIFSLRRHPQWQPAILKLMGKLLPISTSKGFGAPSILSLLALLQCQTKKFHLQ